MKLVKPSVTVIDEPNMLKRIELAGRTCYKSQDKITDDSAEKFVRNIISRGHESVLEHSNIVIEANTPEAIWQLEEIFNDYTKRTMRPHFIRHGYGEEEWEIENGHLVTGERYFSGNARAWRNICKQFHGEDVLGSLFNGHPLFYDIPFACSRTSIDEDNSYADAIIVPSANGIHHNIITIRAKFDRGISHEAVRHRLQSFSQASTRFIRYSDDMRFTEPWWWGGDEKYDHSKLSRAKEILIDLAMRSEGGYQEIVSMGLPAQMARAGLLTMFETEIVITATVYEWIEWLGLRATKEASPDIQRIAALFKEATGITKEGLNGGT